MDQKFISKWGKGIGRFLNDQQGLEVVEYSILAGLIVAGIVATLAAIGGWVAGVYITLRNLLGA